MSSDRTLVARSSNGMQCDIQVSHEPQTLGRGALESYGEVNADNVTVVSVSCPFVSRSGILKVKTVDNQLHFQARKDHVVKGRNGFFEVSEDWHRLSTSEWLVLGLSTIVYTSVLEESVPMYVPPPSNPTFVRRANSQGHVVEGIAQAFSTGVMSFDCQTMATTQILHIAEQQPDSALILLVVNHVTGAEYAIQFLSAEHREAALRAAKPPMRGWLGAQLRGGCSWCKENAPLRHCNGKVVCTSWSDASRTTVAWEQHPDTTDGADVLNSELPHLYLNHFYDQTCAEGDDEAAEDESESEDDEGEREDESEDEDEREDESEDDEGERVAGPSGKQPKRKRSPATVRPPPRGRSLRGNVPTGTWPEV
tara:strand:- start:212 stop:1309 length:1098 start_codon:yes stop_codon:yes gene_type:complete